MERNPQARSEGAGQARKAGARASVLRLVMMGAIEVTTGPYTHPIHYYVQ
jgi:hypothetical protein